MTASAIPLRLHDISRRLQSDKDLVRLDLRGLNVGLNGVVTLSAALRQNSHLRALNLSYNLIPSEGAVLIVKSIPKTVETLDLRDNGVGNDGATAIGDYLSEQSESILCLNNLLLRNNCIGARGAAHLAQSLQFNHSLQRLDLGSNLIGNHGAEAVGILLSTNKSLQWLSLWNNNIDSRGVHFIAEGVAANSSLEVLLMGANDIGDSGAMDLAHALRKNTSLKRLNIGSGHIGSRGGVALAGMLKVNDVLHVVDLFHNPIGLGGAFAFLSILRSHNRTLRQLHIDYQRVTNSGEVNEAIAIYLGLNRVGRSQLKDVKLCWSLWPTILEKLSRSPQLMYLVLAEKPEIVKDVKSRA